MVATQQQAMGTRKFYDPDVIMPLTDVRPACANDMYDPAWWDTDTHYHRSQRRCGYCTQALSICAECPLQQRCAGIGERTRISVLIYAGGVYSPMGRVPGCRNCKNPLPAKSGRIAIVPTCSIECNHELRAKARSGRTAKATAAASAPMPVASLH